LTHMHYFPISIALATLFFAVLLGLFILVEIGLLSRAYSALGLNPRVVTLVLLASLLGSYINLPLLRLPEKRVVVSREMVQEFFGVPFVVPAPVAVDWPGTILAINVGGGVIPILLSFYLLVRYRLWAAAAVAVAIVAFFVHRMATPVPGVGISVPMIAPPLLAAFVALVLSRRFAAPIAYIGGSIGVLIGADLLNLGALRSLGAPVASIGGAGTFDGVFLTGVIAVLLASFVLGRG
jgi:uncharacterized membrane protein